jgi:hypothetical protein
MGRDVLIGETELHSVVPPFFADGYTQIRYEVALIPLLGIERRKKGDKPA